MNLCTKCNQDFGSVQAFDAHRVGKHEYTYSEGLDMEPAREDGRRCLDVTELPARGFVLNNRGTWSLETALNSVRTLNIAEPRERSESGTETLTCQKCSTDFERPVVRGRKPRFCPSCREA